MQLQEQKNTVLRKTQSAKLRSCQCCAYDSSVQIHFVYCNFDREMVYNLDSTKFITCLETLLCIESVIVENKFMHF